MSHKQKGQLTKDGERHKHLRKYLKRIFWKGERKAEKGMLFQESNSESELSWKTPISGCEGYVSFIDNGEDEPFYGCGETGVIWRTKDAFYRDIESIISISPHRKHFYEFKNGEWMPVDDVSEDIDDLIEAEDEETITNYERC
jgi:hypothetical protein